MQQRPLGRTGVVVSAVGLGGFHMGKARDMQTAIQMIRTAIDGGITFMDNSWDYHGGRSEIWMGAALRDGYRQRVFLMTKLDGQTKQSAAEQLRQSLRRLQTDVIDLVQMHEIIRPEDPERIFAPEGAIEALLEARDAGLIRYIGFTGHKSPAMHLTMLNHSDFAWDTVQMPLNCLDAHFDSFERRVLPVLVERGIGVLGMKPLAGSKALETGTVSADECLRYALSLPASVVITGCETVEQVEQALRAGRDFTPISADERADLLRRTEPHAQSGRFERYKTTDIHDSTKHNPRWLTSAAA
jgi:aryl-alcohol dehydrogenase-like predicted oxidoreductase